MNEQALPAPFWAKLATALASFVTLGFLAWASVVYVGWQDVREMLFNVSRDIATMSVQLENIESKIVEAKIEQYKHEQRPWHDQAGNNLSTIRLELDNLRERLDIKQ